MEKGMVVEGGATSSHTTPKDGVSDEVLKLQLNGNSDGARSAAAYVQAEGLETEELQRQFAANFLKPPTEEELGHAEESIRKRLAVGDIGVLMPCKESTGIVGEVLDDLSEWIQPEKILVVDNGSSDTALTEVRRRKGVKLVYQDEILETLDLDRLLPILNLTERKQFRGKGVAVLAGMLWRYFQAFLDNSGRPGFVIQCDAEMKDVRRYRLIEHLMYALLQRPDAQYLKMAKSGRGNERVMMMRNLLWKLSKNKNVPANIRERARTVALRLASQKWMLAGEFMYPFVFGIRRPFATGYVEETLISLIAGGVLPQDGWIQIGNSGPRLDGANTPFKETAMQTEISSFLQELVWAADVPLQGRWIPEVIEQFNREMGVLDIFHIPEQQDSPKMNPDGPVIAESIMENRIIPSVEELDKGGFINWGAARALALQKS